MTDERNFSLDRKMSRRAFLRRTAWAGAGVLGVGGVAAYARKVEPQWIEIKRVDLLLPRLHPAFDGWTLAQLSDLHVGAWMNRERLQRVVQMVNELRPHLVAITGDFVTRLSLEHSGFMPQVLSTLEPRYDTFGVLGNHDHWTNVKVVKAAVRKSGVQELENSFHTIRRDGGELHICGLDDAWVGAADMSRITETLPAGGAAILLAHEPDLADEYVQTRRFDAQLSGHTHGGQVRLPLMEPFILPSYGKKYHNGRYRIAGTPHGRSMTLYVNRGVGMVWPYVRLHCRPEITLFTLRSGQQFSVV